MSEYDYYHLDGYDLFYLPGIGGYSGYNPKARRSEVATLSSKVALHWGVIQEDQIITLAAPYCSREEFLSLQGRYLANDEQGNPRSYYFEDPDYTFEVEILNVEGSPYRGIYQNIQLDLKVLSVHEKTTLTRLYLQDNAATFSGRPANSEATAETDEGLAGAARLTCLKLLPALPAGGVVSREWALQLSTQHRNLVGIWASEPLCRRRIPMGIHCRVTSAIYEQGGAPGSLNAAAFIYLWRPGVGYVGTISASDKTSRSITLGGDEGWGNTYKWRAVDGYPAENIEVLPNDRIVCELWLHHVGSQFTLGDIQGVRFNGLSVYQEGEVAEDPALYIEFPKGVKA